MVLFLVGLPVMDAFHTLGTETAPGLALESPSDAREMTTGCFLLAAVQVLQSDRDAGGLHHHC